MYDLKQMQKYADKGNVFVDDIPESVYHAFPAMSASGLKQFKKGPGYWKYWRENPEPDTAARLSGRLVHMALGEPDRFKREVHIVDGNRNVTAVKEEVLYHKSLGKTVCKTEQAEEALAIAEVCRKHSLVGEILKAGKSERTMLWKDPATGVQCKARVDWMTPNGTMVDWKTFGPVYDDDAIEYQLRSNDYHFQACFYRIGYCCITRQAAPAFYHGFIRNELPYDVAIRKVAEFSINETQPYITGALMRFNDCLRLEDWPLTPPEVNEIELKPFWK